MKADPQTGSAGPKGVTLLELLITLGVLIVLAALLFPVFRKQAEQSRNARCLFNLNQVGIALLTHAYEHNGQLMPWVEEDPRPAQGSHRWHTRLTEGGYASTRDVFFCPSLPPVNARQMETNYQKQWDQVALIYGLREWSAPGQGYNATRLRPKSLTLIEKPAEFFLLADSYHPPRGTQGYVIRPGENNDTWLLHLRHQGRANAFFADGHCAPMDRAFVERINQTEQAYGKGPFLTADPTDTHP